MALTRTDDKLDKNITRLLMQSPLGLTIGDITAAAKCTPQTARKSLARIGADKDASGMLYVLRDDDEQAAPAPEPAPDVPAPEQAAPDPAPAAVAEVPEPADQPEHAPANVAGPLPDLHQHVRDLLASMGTRKT